MLSTPLCRFAAPHTISRLPDSPNTRLHIRKARLFYRCVLLYPSSLSGAASVSLKKSKVRDACVLSLGAKCKRFCVLTNGRAYICTVGYLFFGLQQQSTLRIGRTEVRIHQVCLPQTNSLLRRTQKPVRQHGVPTLPDLSPRGS